MVVPSIAPPLMSAAPITTEPAPFGVMLMLPSVFVAVIAFASSFRLSTRRSVTAEAVPIVTPSIDPPSMFAVVTVPKSDTVAPLRLTVPFADILVKSPAALVPLPMTVLSIVPALISAESATKLSMFAVPSRCRSLNCAPEVPRSTSLLVTGATTPS